MQLSDAVSAIVLEEGPQVYLIYYHGQEDEYSPVDVTHITIHLSVRVIKDCALDICRQLGIVILNDGLEEIGLDN